MKPYCILLLFFPCFFLSCGEKQQIKNKGMTKISIDGSSTLESSIQQLILSYKKDHPSQGFTNKVSSSGKGVQKLINNQIHIARVSRSLKKSEVEQAELAQVHLKPFLIAYDAVVIIIHPSKSKYLQGITKQQALDIFFTGKISSWSQLHKDLEGNIKVYVRESNSSGTSETFNRTITNSNSIPYVQHAIPVVGSPKLVSSVAEDKNGISYSSYITLNDQVFPLKYGSTSKKMVLFSDQSVSNDEYLLKRNLHLVVREPISIEIASFLDFVLSRKGQKVLKQNNLITLR